MLSTLGALVNIGIIIYLGIQAKSGLTPEQLSNLGIEQNPLVLSCAAILALLLALKSNN
jgi:membrane protein DedA with SNARE-associated domain